MYFVWMREKNVKTAIQYHVFMVSVIIRAVMIQD